jgi:hypothetical protein
MGRRGARRETWAFSVPSGEQNAWFAFSSFCIFSFILYWQHGVPERGFGP